MSRDEEIMAMIADLMYSAEKVLEQAAKLAHTISNPFNREQVLSALREMEVKGA